MFKHEWAREVRDLCVKAKVPFLFKQGSALYPGQDRVLDKREWNEAPFAILKHETPVQPAAPIVRKFHMDDPELEDVPNANTDQRVEAERAYNAEVMARHNLIFEMASRGIPLDPTEYRIVMNRREIERDRATLLDIAPGLVIHAEDLVGKHTALLGMTGMGKSNLVAVLIEELAPHIQMTVIDLEGEYRSLRDVHPFLVVGKGEYDDREVDVTDAGKLANEIMETGDSVILDMYDFDEEDRNEFLRLYLNRLFEVEGRKRKPHIVVMEEATEFLNQRRKSPVSEAAIRVANRGRKRGIGLIMVSQRPAALDKNVLNQTRLLFLLGTQFSRDIGAYRGMLPKTFDTENTAMHLKVGQSIVRRAGAGGGLEVNVYDIRRRYSKDLGATPTLQKQFTPEPMA
jgi:DNA helicase HerA-like ATPase